MVLSYSNAIFHENDMNMYWDNIVSDLTDKKWKIFI